MQSARWLCRGMSNAHDRGPGQEKMGKGVYARPAMHELSIAIDLLAAVERNLEPGGARVVKVIANVGSAAGIAAESLRFAFHAVASGTRVDGAELLVTIVAARSRCTPCGKVFEFAGMIGRCPECARLGGELLSGDEVMLRAIEVADV
jgi:hydrogenase nickel incorporation protein HypA/HybF